MRRGAGRIGRLTALVMLVALLPAAAGAKDFEQRVVAEPGGELRVDLEGGAVVVESHSADEVRVHAVAAGLGARRLDFELESHGERVTLRGRGASGWIPALIGGGPHVRVHVRVPREFSLDIQTTGSPIEVEDIEGRVKARTSGGRIDLRRIEGAVDAETSGGPIVVGEVEGDVRVRTSGGPIRLFDIEGSVEARTSGGSIEVLGASEGVRAKTSGGSITVRFDEDPGGRLETSGGGIDVELPEDSGVELNARTSGGQVQIDPNVSFDGRIEPSQANGELNGGGDRLRLQTSGGSIRVHVR